LRRAPERFEFFQAVRLFELEAGSRGEHAPIGFDTPPGRESLRLRAAPSLSFPSAPLRSATGGADEQTTLNQAAVCLVGVLGVMPQHYTELVLRRAQQKDFSLRDFLDMFHHRTAAFFYRAWRKYRFVFDFEHAQLAKSGDDDFTHTLRALVGLATGGLGREDAREWLYFSGLFADPRRSETGLSGLLRDVLGAPVVIEQFVGRWMELEPEQCSRLSSAPEGDDSRRLGLGFVLGTRVWDVQTKVRARVGPLDRQDFVSLLPGTPRLAEVERLVRDYVDAEIACELELVLAPGQVTPARLGGMALLGRDTFLEAGASSTMPLLMRIPLRTDREPTPSPWTDAAN
jgi:type VI secretion system protein ImpH